MAKLKASDIDFTDTSDYLSEEFYEQLLADRAEAENFGPCPDLAVVNECAALLHLEARYLDQRRYKDWLDLYTRDAVYWVPQDDRADIRRHINLMFDDRRRMEDRVLRQLSNFAHSVRPDRFFQRTVANVEAWHMPDGRRRVLASQVAYEYRRGRHVDQYVYRTDHTLREVDGAWKIAVKRSSLLNMDAAVEPPTLL